MSSLSHIGPRAPGLCRPSLGFAIASQVQTLNRPDITVRPLAGTPPMLSTYLLRRSAEASEPMKRFLQRAREEFLPKGDEPAS